MPSDPMIMLGQLLEGQKRQDGRLKAIDERLDSIERDVEANHEQLRLWKAIRIVLGWVIGTTFAAFGAIKGIKWMV